MNILAKIRSNAPNKKSIILYLHRKNYRDIKLLGSGGFGDVFEAVSPQQMNVAIKVISDKKAWELEAKVWPALRHPNILSTIKIMEVKYLHCKMYVTPKHPSTLHGAIRSSDFKNDRNGLRRVKKWFSEILSAVDYLHLAKYCHLDLKGDNVLISMEDSAVLCDFSGLNVTGKNLERLVAPKQFRPPECFGKDINKVEGVRFDMWSYGLMVLNELTDYYMVRRTGQVRKGWTWQSKVRPVLTEMLQKIHFNNKFDKAFQHVWVSEEDKAYALHFVRSLLRFDPEERPSAAQVLRHPFLKEVLQDSAIRARDICDGFEDIANETSLPECEEVSAEIHSTSNRDQSRAAEESSLLLMFSAQSFEDTCVSLENAPVSEKEDLKLKNVRKELCDDVLENSLLVTNIKEQNEYIAAHTSLNDTFPSMADIEGENLSTELDDLDSKEYLLMVGDCRKKINKISLTKKWFKKKFKQVFRRTEK